MDKCGEKVHVFNLEKYTALPILCNFTRVFSNARQDTRHRHGNFYELVIFVEGSTLDHQENDIHILQPGFFFMYAPGSIHNYRNMLHSKYLNLLIRTDFFQTLAIDRQCMPDFEQLFPADGEKSRIYQLDETGLKQAVDMAFEIRRELTMQPVGWEEMLKILLKRFFIHLWRNKIDTADKDDASFAFSIGRSITYMEKNLVKNLTIGDLAKFVSMSESSYRHYFKSVTSYSPIHYLILLRLKNAAELLFLGKGSSEAAAASGLRDSSYFGRMCRKYLGKSLQELCEICRSSAFLPDNLIADLIKNNHTVDTLENVE